MSLLKCRECGKDVSDTAEQCPNCGADSPSLTQIEYLRYMFWGAIFLILIIIFMLNRLSPGFIYKHPFLLKNDR